MIKVPETCLICGSHFIGGHETPGQEMKEGLRVFYRCGASISCREISEGIYQVLIKNCELSNQIKYPVE